MVVRLPVALAALAATFTAGALASHLVGDAHAQPASVATTLYVPTDGLTFRTFTGQVVARLSYDAHGGELDLFDEKEQPTRIQADARRPAATAAQPAPGNPLDERF